MAVEGNPFSSEKNPKEGFNKVIFSLREKRLKEAADKLGGLNLTFREVDGNIIAHDVTEDAANLIVARDVPPDQLIDRVASSNYL